MPERIKHIFEKEYGKKKGDKIFYAWENKHHMMEKKPINKIILTKPKSLIITGKPAYVKHMYSHLRKEHPSTRKRMTLINPERRK